MSPSAGEVEDGQQAFAHEKSIVDIDENAKTSTPTLKLDKHGLPLVPQPSDHRDDPLVSRNSCTGDAQILINKYKSSLTPRSRIGLLH